MRSVNLWRDRLSSLLGLRKRDKSSTPGGGYSEEVFRSLVQSESTRSKRSGQLFRILLVYRTDAQGGIVPMKQEIATKAIAVLSTNLRATDYIGWYREEYILGALLTTLQPDSVVDGYQNLKTRLADRLRGALTFTGDRSPQIRVIEQGELTALNAFDRPASSLGSKDYTY